ncbi:CDGSH iron-sulfur domain-containing protein [Pricia sp.]|uniref:CDGSH iron-sulfur domain-containing protein n=1 Tax=Pricia sp. TaxID=2268138 RepID=UPI0035937B84
MGDKSYNPIQVDLKTDKRYSWCTCSFSSEQPFCDGSHKAKRATPPMVFEVKEDRDAWLCTCKRTGTPPYCDGSHKTV